MNSIEHKYDLSERLGFDPHPIEAVGQYAGKFVMVFESDIRREFNELKHVELCSKYHDEYLFVLTAEDLMTLARLYDCNEFEPSFSINGELLSDE